MVLDDTQSTAVSDSSPVAVSESTGTLAPAVEQSGEQTQERSGDDTAPSALVEATKVEEGETTPPPAEEDDPLKDVPTVEELEQQAGQRVPYAQALLKLRTALEARNSELGELRGKATTAEPVLPLIEQYGGTETVTAKLTAYDSLFTPVVNPETQQPEIDPATGFPRTTALPFIERVDAENPGMAEQLLMDTLNYKVDFTGGGQKQFLYQHPAVQEVLFKALRLDPTRADDYRNIDALSAPDTAVGSEELAEIPEQFREVYKTLPPGIRTDLKVQDDMTRQFNLTKYQRDFDREQADAQRQQTDAQTRQQAEVQARQYVEKEQDSFVTQQIQETYGQIMADVKSQVTLPEGSHAVVGALLFSLRDPDFRAANAPELEALGVKLNGDFDQALERADQAYRDAKRYELLGQTELSRRSLAQAKSAKNEVLAKLAPVALKAAKVVASARAGAAKEHGKLLDDATRTRPVPTGNQTDGGGLLPDGVRANDPSVGVNLWRQMQARTQ